ncbi:MAG: hypothetical protein HY040_01415 [Planctomycetes bacterium]|nr:hypothetical protein [Planctomycetota bacterium]
MPSRAEELTSRSLRAILGPLAKGTNLQDSEEFQDVLVDLEYFVPELLAEVYSEWNHEALDGIMPMLARKTGEATAEIFGLCFIMSEQILAPIQMSLRISASSDEVSWLECSWC